MEQMCCRPCQLTSYGVEPQGDTDPILCETDADSATITQRVPIIPERSTRSEGNVQLGATRPNTKVDRKVPTVTEKPSKYKETGKEQAREWRQV